MARETEVGRAFRPIVIWDIDRTVGLGRGSSRPDVMLVQFFINRVMKGLRLRDDRKPFNPGPDNPLRNQHHGFPLLDFLVEDGYCGHETSYAIRQYQKAQCRVVDSAVDPVYPLLDGQQLAIDTRMMFKLNQDNLRQHGKVIDPSELPPLVRADLPIAEF